MLKDIPDRSRDTFSRYQMLEKIPSCKRLWRVSNHMRALAFIAKLCENFWLLRPRIYTIDDRVEIAECLSLPLKLHALLSLSTLLLFCTSFEASSKQRFRQCSTFLEHIDWVSVSFPGVTCLWWCASPPRVWLRTKGATLASQMCSKRRQHCSKRPKLGSVLLPHEAGSHAGLPLRSAVGKYVCHAFPWWQMKHVFALTRWSHEEAPCMEHVSAKYNVFVRLPQTCNVAMFYTVVSLDSNFAISAFPSAYGSLCVRKKVQYL